MKSGARGFTEPSGAISVFPWREGDSPASLGGSSTDYRMRYKAAVATDVEGGAPLVRYPLLASELYEALKLELRATSELEVVERTMVAAATGLCRHAATRKYHSRHDAG